MESKEDTSSLTPDQQSYYDKLFSRGYCDGLLNRYIQDSHNYRKIINNTCKICNNYNFDCHSLMFFLKSSRFNTETFYELIDQLMEELPSHRTIDLNLTPNIISLLNYLVQVNISFPQEHFNTLYDIFLNTGKLYEVKKFIKNGNRIEGDRLEEAKRRVLNEGDYDTAELLELQGIELSEDEFNRAKQIEFSQCHFLLDCCDLDDGYLHDLFIEALDKHKYYMVKKLLKKEVKISQQEYNNFVEKTRRQIKNPVKELLDENLETLF